MPAVYQSSSPTSQKYSITLTKNDKKKFQLDEIIFLFRWPESEKKSLKKYILQKLRFFAL